MATHHFYWIFNYICQLKRTSALLDPRTHFNVHAI